MNVLNPNSNFLGITEVNLYSYNQSKCVIQQIPYEHTSTHKKGSSSGPSSILKSSHFVEYYDIELQQETYKKCGIASLSPIDFGNLINEEAMDVIYQESRKHLENNKFIVSLGAEHTITYGIFKAVKEKWNDIGILQLDAHSDLRLSYENNIWSHASVMARINELNTNIYQVGIRAQSIEEANFINISPHIKTWYAHNIWENEQWMDEVIKHLPSNLYITIDTDGFDPSICPSVGTPEPGG